MHSGSSSSVGRAVHKSSTGRGFKSHLEPLNICSELCIASKRQSVLRYNGELLSDSLHQIILKFLDTKVMLVSYARGLHFLC